MKHLLLLAAVYALIAALVLPSSLLASEDADPAVADTPAGETAPAGETPAAPPEPAPAPEQPATPPEPAPPAPEQPAAAPPVERPAVQPKHKTSAKAAGSGSVTISDFQFSPAQITISQGDTVTWTNSGPTPHSATASGGNFDTGIFPAGQSRSHTFDDAGTFSYVCTPHPNMHGTIVVTASQSGGDTPDSSTGDTGGSGGTTGSTSPGAEATQSDGGPSLPSTGADSGALLVMGALMLLLGIAVHRRARAEQPRPAGRIGW
ncbi:MAG TPA: cupredoxin family copper-binding protein [Thermoleophilaceae bacterium]|nr:cupredoxin family copper-binding protein [Thermoleophilaceae bacterium]